MSSLRRAALAVRDRDDHRRHDGDQPRDQAPQPRADPDVEEALHHDLAGERAGQRRVLSRGEQREREHGAGRRRRAAASAACRRPGSRRPPCCRCVWNVAAATIRIAALMNSANESAIVESMKAKRTASRLPSERLVVACASARWTSAGTGCAASPSRRGCRSRCRALSRSETISARRHEAAHHVGEVGAGEEELEQEADADRGDERDDQRLEQAEALVLQVQQRAARRAP